MKIEVHNGISRVWGTPDELKALDEATSYPVEDAQFSPAFKAKVWDGKEHLLRESKRDGCHKIPTGVLADLPEIEGAELIDARRRPSEVREFQWCSEKMPRDYQVLAVLDALKDRGMWTGRGMLNLPIRSGKTLIAGKLVQVSGLRTLFVVSSSGLLVQTYKAFKDCLGADAPIGMYGDGRHDIDWVTIATAQSLLANPKAAQQLMSQCDLLIVDEAHHLEGEAWRKLVLQSDALFKFGLSATIFVSKDKKNNKASIWLRACTGPILHRVSMARLIEAGHLKRPTVLFYKHEHPHDIRCKDWQWVAREQLAKNPRRNKLLAHLAQRAVNLGKRVLVDTGRKEQMKFLCLMIQQLGISVEMIHGGTSTRARERMIEKLQRGELQCLVGTVLGEGIDIPELEVVINAEGQKSAKAAIQRMRNLTVAEGKGDVYFIDIADMGSPMLQKHALERLRLYKGLRGFIVKACELGKPKYDPLMPSATT